MSVAAESTEIFKRVIEPSGTPMAPALAEYLSSLDFPPKDHERYESLSQKASAGTLTEAETDELDSYLHVDALLSVLRLKGERALRA